MDQTSVWLTRLGSWRQDRERDLVEGLARLGLACQAGSPPAGAGARLVLFDRGAPDLLTWLEENAARDGRRVLALGLTRQSLGGESGWRLLAAGASDFLCLAELADPAAAVAARLCRWVEVDRLLASPLVTKNLVGASRAWRAALAEIVEVARFSDSAVLLGGESGTGKELVARLIHTLDPRPDKRELMILDCTTVHSDLSGSEFFGHERGAFTNAVAARDGAFALADGGTLFLDEVGELPLRLQAELLRVVEEGSYKRIGSNTWSQTRFRLVCATHRDLPAEIREGRFRADFYYRVAAVSCTLPPLAERREDIPLLVRHFLAERCGGSAPEVDPAVLDLLAARDYPGNVRDLRQLMGRIAQRHVGPGPVTLGDLPPDERPPNEVLAGASPPAANGDAELTAAVRAALARGLGLKEITSQVSDAAVRLALESEGGNVHRAAERLGVTDRALQMRRAAWKKEAD